MKTQSETIFYDFETTENALNVTICCENASPEGLLIDFWSPKVPKTLLFLAKTSFLDDFLEYFQNSEKSKFGFLIKKIF